MIHNIKQKIRQELKNSEFPNLKFLYSHEALDVSYELLEELLQEEKKYFQNKISKKYICLDGDLILKNDNVDIEELNFDVFRDFSELDYFFSLLSHYQGVHNDEKIRKIIEDFEPKYVAFGNEIAYSKRYYDMIRYCHTQIADNLEQINTNVSQDKKGKGEVFLQQLRILKKILDAYELRGINLGKKQQSRLKKISQKLSQLSQKFGNNVLDSKKDFEYIIDDENIICEMPEDDKEVARKKYNEKYNIISSDEIKSHKDVKFLFDASDSSYSAIMKYCSHGEIRKYFYDARNQFASQGEYDNREIVLEILNLRHEKALILEKNNYAELALHFKMAENSQQIIQLLDDINTKVQIKAQTEIDELKQYFGLDDIHPWDMSFYMRKLKQQKYLLDEKELKQYFELTQVKQGLFQIAEKVFGVKFQKLNNPDILYDDTIEVYEVYQDEIFLSYFVWDVYYNPLKKQGAWADLIRENYNSYSTISLLNGEKDIHFFNNTKNQDEFKKIVLNVCNFQQGSDGVTLLTYGNVETMFHEFGHALHEILSTCQYSELSGFHVEHDFIELPSQLLENWCRHPDGLKLFAKHYISGDMIPQKIIDTLKILENFGNGNFILKQNEYALTDMKLHSKKTPCSVNELDIIIRNIADELSLLPLGDDYKQYTTFSHIFDGGYAAGYYGYIWAQILETSVWKKFLDIGNIFDTQLSSELTQKIFKVGSKKDATEIFYDFTQSQLDVSSFLEMKGIV